MGVVGSKDTVQDVNISQTNAHNEADLNYDDKNRHDIEHVKNNRATDVEETTNEEYDDIAFYDLNTEEKGKTQETAERETRYLQTHRHEGGKDDIIYRQIHVKQRVESKSKPNIAVTEAEKMLKIYNEERMKAGNSIDDHSRTHNIGVKQNREERNKDIDVGKRIKQPLYKTYDYHEVSRCTPVPEPKDKISLGCDVANNFDVRAVNSHEITSTLENKPHAVLEISSVTDIQSTTVTSEATKTLQKQQPQSFHPSNDKFRQDGTFLSNTFSQYFPNLLEQRKYEISNFTSKPSSSGSLGMDKRPFPMQQVEQQLRSSDTQVNPLSQYEYDTKQQNILHELRDIGIIENTPVFDRYTLSTGCPLRRPPPRTNQLPPLEKDVHSQFNEFQFAPLPPLAKKFKSQKSPPLNVFDDKHRDVIMSPIDMLTEQNTGLKSTADNMGTDTSDELFVKFNNIGDAGKLKLKILDMDIL